MIRQFVRFLTSDAAADDPSATADDAGESTADAEPEPDATHAADDKSRDQPDQSSGTEQALDADLDPIPFQWGSSADNDDESADTEGESADDAADTAEPADAAETTATAGTGGVTSEAPPEADAGSHQDTASNPAEPTTAAEPEQGATTAANEQTGTDEQTAADEQTATDGQPGVDDQMATDEQTAAPHADRVVEPELSTSSLARTPDIHQTVLTPSSIEDRPSTVCTGDTVTQTFWISEYPEFPQPGFLERLYSAPATRATDIAIHIEPRATQATLAALENQIEGLEADFEYLKQKHRANARGVKHDLDDYRGLYDTLRKTATRAFDVSMYLTARGEGRDRSTLDSERVRKTARETPTNLTPVLPRWTQRAALTSCSPIARDKLRATVDTRTPMLGGAVGAMFPFVSGAFAEPGIEYGAYVENGSPLVLDRYSRQTGHCMMVIGMLGAGKSFSTKLQLVRRAMYDPDTMLILVDPLEGGFGRVIDLLGGERLTVGGTRAVNPLELQPTPEEARRQIGDCDPWGEQLTWVTTFFEMFFEQIANNPLEERTQTLRRAIQEAYHQQDITSDPATHDNPSPTIPDVFEALEALTQDPGAFGYATEGEQQAVRAEAESLLKDLRPSFSEAGAFRDLARPTEFDLAADALYFDLQQAEGVGGDAELSLRLQVLFNSLYEQIKQTDQRVLLVIDEAHYLTNDVPSVSFLETAVRHSRHYDLSIQFITQTGEEFELTDETKTIAKLCSHQLFHRVSSHDAKTIADWFDLSLRQAQWINNAKAGDEGAGYSEALLGIEEEGWFPIRVRPSPAEIDALTDDADESTDESTDEPADRLGESGPEPMFGTERVDVPRWRSSVRSNGGAARKSSTHSEGQEERR